MSWRLAKGEIMARQTRIERATPAFGGLYSIQLSYWRGDDLLQARYFTLIYPQSKDRKA